MATAQKAYRKARADAKKTVQCGHHKKAKPFEMVETNLSQKEVKGKKPKLNKRSGYDQVIKDRKKYASKNPLASNKNTGNRKRKGKRSKDSDLSVATIDQ